MAWDGRSYPGPPPEDWYEASDGRWWAPGSGPNPPSPGTPPSPNPAPDTTPTTEAAAGSTTPPARPDDEPPTPPVADATDDERPTVGPLPTVTAQRRLRPRRRTVGLALASIVFAGGAVAAAFVLAGGPGDDGGSDTSTVAGPTTSARPTTTTTAAPTPTDLEPADDGPGVETSGPDAEATDADGADGDASDDEQTDPPSTATTTTAIDDPTTTAPVDANAPVRAFRQFLADAGLDGSDLGDADVVDFGRTVCVVAAVEDGPGYTAFRTELVDDQAPTSALTAEELGRTVDAAVQAFCPAEHARLGLTS